MKKSYADYKPNGYWTVERLKEEASKFKTRNEFRKGNVGAYRSAVKKKVLDEVFVNLPSKNVEIWTKERCLAEAAKYPTLTALKNVLPGAYEKIRKKKWLVTRVRVQSEWSLKRVREAAKKYSSRSDFKKAEPEAYAWGIKRYSLKQIAPHIEEVIFWTEQRCREVATKYKTRSQFRDNCGGAFEFAKKKGFIDDLFPVRPKVLKWTREACRQEFLKYETKNEFISKSRKAYEAASKNRWLPYIYGDLLPSSHKIRRWVYAYEFPDKSVYVGLTYDLNRRNIAHTSSKLKNGLKKSTVHKHITETQTIPNFVILTDNLQAEQAVTLENEWVKEYVRNGWKILNKAKTGSLGFGKKYSIEMCVIEAKKYTTRIDFRIYSSKYYDATIRNGWHDEVMGHLLSVRRPYKKKYTATFEECFNAAQKYSSLNQFKVEEPYLYNCGRHNCWIRMITVHMEKREKKICYVKKTQEQKNERFLNKNNEAVEMVRQGLSDKNILKSISTSKHILNRIRDLIFT